jgi:hypothetical protein
MISVRTGDFDPGRERKRPPPGRRGGAGALGCFVGRVRDLDHRPAIRPMQPACCPGMTEKALSDSEQEARSHWELTGTMPEYRQHTLSSAAPRRRFLRPWGLFGFVLWTSLAIAAQETEAPGNNPDPKQLNALSQQLIERVKTGKAEAATFRIDVVVYRESLRSLMLANEKAAPHRIDNSLLLQMVRMAALLQAAAACQTGRYISCPVNLMNELERQQQGLTQALQGPSSPP